MRGATMSELVQKRSTNSSSIDTHRLQNIVHTSEMVAVRPELNVTTKNPCLPPTKLNTVH